MSDGNISDSGGKPDGPWGRRPGDGSPIIGRTFSRLRHVLEGQGTLARETSDGASPVHEQNEKPKRRKKKKRRDRGVSQGRSKSTFFALLITIGVMVLVLAGVFLIRPEASMPKPEGLLGTRIQMKGFELAVRSYYVKYRRLPDGSGPELLAILAGENLNGQNPDSIVFMSLREPVYRFGRVVKPGDTDEDGNYLDGWGRPMSIRVDHINRRMWIRSMGPNGTDDQGVGDDIEMMIVADI